MPQGCAIDDLAAQHVNLIFVELRAAFPAWRATIKTKDELNAAKRSYTKALMESDLHSMALIQHGLEMARNSDIDFFPSAGKFVSWCLSNERNAWEAPFQRLIHREKPVSRLEEVVASECSFEVRQAAEGVAQKIYSKCFLKWLPLAKAGKLPPKPQAPKALAAPKAKAVDPDQFTQNSVFHRVAKRAAQSAREC